jgi:hypothetical protein
MTARTSSSERQDVAEVIHESAFHRHIEIIATFFTARYYNEIYDAAHTYFARQGGKSLTDVYMRTLAEYLRDIEQPNGEGIVHTIRALHDYDDRYCGRSSLDEFIARIIEQIAPEEFYVTIGRHERDAILRGLVSQVAISMGKRALCPDMLRMIIDNRDDRNGITILRNNGAQVLRDFKASFMSKLYSDKVSTSQRVVSSEVFCKLRDEFRANIGLLAGAEIDAMRARVERDEARRELAFVRARLDETEKKLASANAAMANAAMAASSRAKTTPVPPIPSGSKRAPLAELHGTRPSVEAQPSATARPVPLRPADASRSLPLNQPRQSDVRPIVTFVPSTVRERAPAASPSGSRPIVATPGETHATDMEVEHGRGASDSNPDASGGRDSYEGRETSQERSVSDMTIVPAIAMPASVAGTEGDPVSQTYVCGTSTPSSFEETAGRSTEGREADGVRETSSSFVDEAGDESEEEDRNAELARFIAQRNLELKEHEQTRV